MKRINIKAKHLVRTSGEISLPVFNKNANGEYESVGQTSVKKLKDLKFYLSTYQEIAKIIKENYSREIYRIYENALSNLILSNNNKQDLFEEYANGWTDEHFLAKKRNGLSINSRTLKRIIKSEAFSEKRFKPAKNLINNIKNPMNNSKYFILPEMTENGVVVVPDETFDCLAVRFNKYSVEEAENIEAYLYSVANEIEDPEFSNYSSQKIEELFNLSKKAKERTVDAETLLRNMAEVSIDLMGVDMTPYEKKKVSSRSKTEPSQEIKVINKEEKDSANKENTQSKTEASKIVVMGDCTMGMTPLMHPRHGTTIVISPVNGYTLRYYFDKEENSANYVSVPADAEAPEKEN